jgi:septum formation protein
MASQLILASGSPRRKELLESLGFVVKAIPPNIDETRHDGEEAENFVKRLAREKVLAVVQRLHASLYTDEEGASRPLRSSVLGSKDETRWVIGADTVVVLDGDVFEKPRDSHDAYEMLSRLSGTDHQVITGFCLYDIRKSKEGLQAVHTQVRFKELSKTEIEKYVELGEGADKAGSYAAQGVGAYFIEWLQGSYTNVVGLPLCQVVEMMQEMGARSILPFG